jgi:putative membrane protein
MNTLVNVLVSGVAVFVTSRLLRGVSVDGFGPSVLVAVLLGLVNAFLGPLLLVLTLPLNVATLGLFTFVIMAGLVQLVDWIVPGFQVAGFWWALAFALVLAAINSLLHSLVRR